MTLRLTSRLALTEVERPLVSHLSPFRVATAPGPGLPEDDVVVLGRPQGKSILSTTSGLVTIHIFIPVAQQRPISFPMPRSRGKWTNKHGHFGIDTCLLD
jgi:hypothetical protein